MKHLVQRSSGSGYILFEVVLALTIFALTVVKLTGTLQAGLEVAGDIANENKIHIGLRSFIEETRRKQVSEMATQTTDDTLGVTYSSTVDDLTLKNQDGTVLQDLYVLHAKANWGDGDNAREEAVDLYLYEPSGQNINNPQGGAANSGSATSNSAASGGGSPSSSSSR